MHKFNILQIYIKEGVATIHRHNEIHKTVYKTYVLKQMISHRILFFIFI